MRRRDSGRSSQGTAAAAPWRVSKTRASCAVMMACLGAVVIAAAASATPVADVVSARSLVTPSPAGALAVATVVMPDGSKMVVGTVAVDSGEQAAVWRRRADGAIDSSFTAEGMFVDTEPGGSRGLSVQQSSDGTVHIGVMAGPAGSRWLEVHRWRAGLVSPLRVARQAMPPTWSGTATLIAQGAGWSWIDASDPSAQPMALVMVTRDSPWKSASYAPQVSVPVPRAAKAPRRAEAALASPPTPVETTEKAGFSPFNTGSAVPVADKPERGTAWAWWALVSLGLAGVTGLWVWGNRRSIANRP